MKAPLARGTLLISGDSRQSQGSLMNGKTAISHRWATSTRPDSRLFPLLRHLYSCLQRLGLRRQAGLCRLSFVHLSSVDLPLLSILLSTPGSYSVWTWILFAGRNTIFALQHCTYLKNHTLPIIQRETCSQQAF